MDAPSYVPAPPTAPVAPLPVRPQPARRTPRTSGVVDVALDIPAPPPSVRHPITAMSAMLTAASAVDTLAMPWPWLLGATGVASLAAPLATSLRLPNAKPDALFAAASTAAAGGWLTYAATTTPWSGAAIGALAAGAAAFAPVYGLIRWRRDKLLRAGVQLRAGVRANAKRRVWELILQEAKVKDVQVVDDEQFPSGVKFQLELGPNAPDLRTLMTYVPAIEKIAALRTGLPIRSGTIELKRRDGQFAHRAR